MITRLRHRNLHVTPQAEKNIHHDESQKPIYDAIATSVKDWNILGLTKDDAFAYEDTTVFLMQHLPETHDLHSVKKLLLQVLAKQHVYPDFSPEQMLSIQSLADDIFECWNQYLQRNETSTFSQARFKALMSRHHSPRTHSR